MDIDLKELSIRESERVEWKENGDDKNPIVTELENPEDLSTRILLHFLRQLTHFQMDKIKSAKKNSSFSRVKHLRKGDI